jgi:pimeloyl-ACP methyl ester carboxylesterase
MPPASQSLLQHRLLDLPGCELSLHTGSTGEPIVLLHGFTRTGRSHWQDEEIAFLEDYQLIIPDLRGHGLSQNRSGCWSHLDIAEDIHNMCQLLGLDRAHFVGFSSGGMALYYLALTHPELICSMTCISSGIRIEQLTRDTIAEACSVDNPGYQQTISYLDRLHAAGQGEGYGRKIMALWQELTTGGGDPDLSSQQLSGISSPLLIVHGDNDSFFPLQQAQEAHAAVVDSLLLILNNESHFITGKVNRSIFQQELLTFLAAHPCSAL